MTLSTTTYNRGDVVLVPFPFTNLRRTEQRPAVVISTDAYNASTTDLIIAPITSQVTNARFGDHMVSNHRAAGLHYRSIVRAKLATLNESLVRKPLGKMPAVDMAAIEQNLKAALAL